MKILHISDRIGALAEGGGAEVICAGYIRLGQQMGYLSETITLESRSAAYRFQLRAQIEQIAPDLIHLHNSYSLLTPELATKIVDSYPTLSSIYDVRPICPTTLKLLGDGRYCEQPVGVRCLTQNCPLTTSWGDPHHTQLGQLRIENVNLLQQNLARLRRSQVAVLSPYLKSQFLLNGFLPEDVTVVTPPLNVPLLEQPPLERFGGPRLLYVGRLDRNKGLYFLAEVLEHLETPDWHLDIVGDSPERVQLEHYYRRKSLRGTITFHGFQTPAQLLSFYDQATVLVVPSLIAETLCQVIAEAMARGLPVVSLAAGAVADWVRPGETGILLLRPEPQAFARSIDQLVNDSAEAQRIARNAWEYVRTAFSEAVICDQLKEAYTRALSRFRSQGDARQVVLPPPDPED